MVAKDLPLPKALDYSTFTLTIDDLEFRRYPLETAKTALEAAAPKLPELRKALAHVTEHWPPDSVRTPRRTSSEESAELMTQAASRFKHCRHQARARVTAMLLKLPCARSNAIGTCPGPCGGWVRRGRVSNTDINRNTLRGSGHDHVKDGMLDALFRDTVPTRNVLLFCDSVFPTLLTKPCTQLVPVLTVAAHKTRTLMTTNSVDAILLPTNETTKCTIR